MNMKLFFSYQSELPDCSKAIRKSIDKAVKAVNKEYRVNVSIVIGASGFPGMADIPDAIDKNIADCDIFVADLTPTHIDAGRANPNVNVMMELGQAKAYLGVSRMIGVTCTNAGDPWLDKDLPFDFNKNRIKHFKATDSINLENDLKYVVEYILNPSKRRIEDVKEKREAELMAKLSPVDSVEFFTLRLANAFPGIRGIQTITNPDEINMHLKSLLADPISFERLPGQKGDTDPIWLFRGGQGMYISGYRYDGKGKFLIRTVGWDELQIKSITVFRDTAQYYKQYVYIEALAEQPTGLYQVDQELIEGIKELQGYYAEEYAILKNENNQDILITIAERDDGSAIRNGKILDVTKAELRIRYLTGVNFLMCAKFSAFNCNEFCRTSQEVMDNVLSGIWSHDVLHQYLMRFPKPQYRY